MHSCAWGLSKAKHFALQHRGAEDQDVAAWCSLLNFANIAVLQLSALHRAGDLTGGLARVLFTL